MLPFGCNVVLDYAYRNEVQLWHSGESTHLPPMGSGFDYRTLCHMWVEFVAGSLPCSETFFSR